MSKVELLLKLLWNDFLIVLQQFFYKIQDNKSGGNRSEAVRRDRDGKNEQ